MTITSLKDLQKLIALCRRTGVQSIRVDGVELHLGEAPQKTRRVPLETPQVVGNGSDFAISPGGITENTKISIPSEWDLLTEEQRMFYSSRPEAPTFEEQQ